MHDILSSVDDIESFVEGISYEQFLKDRKTLNAVVRSFEIIGEATKHVPASLRYEYGEVPWKKMIAMRDKVIHGYFGVDAKTLWITAKEDLPPLRQLVKRMLKDLEDEKDKNY